MDNFLKLFDLIGVLARRRYLTAERYYSAFGLNHTEARLLRLLSQEGGEAAQDALSNMLYVDRSNAGRALKRLEQEGYIAKRKDDTDKRAYFIQMTEKGHKAVAAMSELTNEIVQSFFGDLTEAEAGTVVDLLKKVVTNEDNA